MEPFKDKRTILDTEDVKDTLSSAIKKPLTVQKKPVKFTWDGLLNFGISLSNTPIGKYNIQSLIDNTLPRATDIVKGRKKPQEKDYIDFFEDMEKSVFGAAQNIEYSIGDLLTTGIDIVADTNLTEALDKIYEENKIADPETLLGSVNKVLIEYGLPGGAVFKIMNRAKKLFKSKKAIDAKKAANLTGQGSKLVNTAKRVGYMSTAFAATDFITSGARSKTQDPMLMDVENEEGLQGRDLALARFRNKLRFGAEGALIGGGFTLMGGPLARIATVGAKYGLFKPAGYALRGIDLLAVRPATYLAANIPGSAAAGDFRYNSDDGKFEGYTNEWGEIGGGGGVSQVSGIVSTTSTVGFAASFAVADFRSASVNFLINDATGASQTGKYLMIHDGTTVTVVEQIAVATGSMLGTVSGQIAHSNAELLVTMVSAGVATCSAKIDTMADTAA